MMNCSLMRLCFLVTAFFWCFVSTAFAEEAAGISSVVNQKDLGRWILYLEDTSRQLGIDDVERLDDSRWQRNRGQLVNFGYTGSAYWFKLSLRNDRNEPQPQILEIGYGVLDHLDVYVVKQGEVSNAFVMGDKLPFFERPIQNRHFLIPLQIAHNETQEIYLRVETSSSVQLPIMLWDEYRFYQVDQARMIFHGIYFGIVLVMIIYNLFVYLAISERTYLHYVCCIFSMAMFLAALNGLTFQYLWPEATWWNDQSIVFFLNAVVLFGNLFSLRFLTIKPKTDYWLNQYLAGMGGMGAVFMVSSLILSYRIMISYTIILAMLACVSLILIGAWRWHKGQVSARYFTVAWFALLSGGIVLALNKFTILPQNIFTENATQIGSAVEIILLSIALADRLNHEKRKAFAAQQQALDLEREARAVQSEYLEAQRNANQLLEQRVHERTQELEKLNLKLLELSSTDALTGLKNRGYFDEAFQHAWLSAYRYQQPMALLILDIDFFKVINDRYGHLIGDECLKMVASHLLDLVARPQDLVARFGGEEFVVLLPDTPVEGARQVAEKIRRNIEQMPFQIATETINISVSVGVNVVTPKSPAGKEYFFEKADEALYMAKTRGRNQVCVAGEWSE